MCTRPKKETALELLGKCHSKLKVSSITPKHLLLQESYVKSCCWSHPWSPLLGGMYSFDFNDRAARLSATVGAKALVMWDQIVCVQPIGGFKASEKYLWMHRDIFPKWWGISYLTYRSKIMFGRILLHSQKLAMQSTRKSHHNSTSALPFHPKRQCCLRKIVWTQNFNTVSVKWRNKRFHVEQLTWHLNLGPSLYCQFIVSHLISFRISSISQIQMAPVVHIALGLQIWFRSFRHEGHERNIHALTSGNGSLHDKPKLHCYKGKSLKTTIDFHFSQIWVPVNKTLSHSHYDCILCLNSTAKYHYWYRNLQSLDDD